MGYILSLFLNLIGCGGNNLFYLKDEEAEAEEDVKKIVASIFQILETKDVEGFKNLFDQSVIDMSDYKEGSDYTFNIFEGTVVSVSKKYIRSGGRTSNQEDSYSTITASFDISTDKNEYVLFFQYYSNHDETIRIDKLTKFKLLLVSDIEKYDGFRDMTAKLGIFYPGWVNIP